METLTLPEPAATLWKKIGPRLEDAMREILGDNERWTMTGGTILTARYKHRSSTDIDLQLAPSAADRLIAKRCPHFMTSMTELGATGGYQGVRQIVISFPRSELDLWQRKKGDERHPEGSEREARIDGRAEHVESNAQILHGKAKRAGRKAPVRDLYDFAVAIEIDRQSLETAINLEPLEEMTTLRKKWRDTAQTYAKDAKTDIKNVPERFAHIQANPADHAAQATENATWTAADLHYENRRLKWRTKCHDGTTNTQATNAPNAAGLRDWMKQTGVDRFIELNEPTQADAITSSAIQIAERGPTGSKTIWSITRDPGFDPGDRNGHGGPGGRSEAPGETGPGDAEGKGPQMVPADPANMMIGGGPTAESITRPSAQTQTPQQSRGPNPNRSTRRRGSGSTPPR